MAHGHARHRLCPRGVGVSLRRRPPARSAVPARNAHGALLRAAAVVRKPTAGNPRHRLPCAGDPRHRIPLADAGPCGGARRRRRRNAGAAAQPALHPAGPDGPHRSGNSSRKTPRTPLSLRPFDQFRLRPPQNHARPRGNQLRRIERQRSVDSHRRGPRLPHQNPHFAMGDTVGQPFPAHPPLVHRQHGAHRPLLPGTRGDRRNDHRDFAQIPGGRAPPRYFPIAAATQRIVGKASRRLSATSRGAHHTAESIPSSVWGVRPAHPDACSSYQWVRFSSQRAVFGK